MPERSSALSCLRALRLCFSPRVRAAVELLKAGADPNDERSGYSALHAITWVRKPNSGDDPDGDPPPIGSGTMSSLQFVRELVTPRGHPGADVNARLQQGTSGRAKLNE